MKLTFRREDVQTILLLIAALGLSVAAVLYTSKHPQDVERLIRTVGLFGPLVIIALYGVLGASPLPSEALSLINGAIYGPLVGTLLGFLGNMLAAVIEYYIGLHIGGVADFEERRKSMPFGLGRFPADSVWFLLFGRLVPGIGGKLVSVVGGVYRVPMVRYLWTAAIPTLVGTALFVFGGWGLLTGF